jgi:hypothetical protein
MNQPDYTHSVITNYLSPSHQDFKKYCKTELLISGLGFSFNKGNIILHVWAGILSEPRSTANDMLREPALTTSLSRLHPFDSTNSEKLRDLLTFRR